MEDHRRSLWSVAAAGPRRSKSLPKGGTERRPPPQFYAFPSTLLDILCSPRQRLTTYAEGMQVLPWAAPTTPTPTSTSEAAAAVDIPDPAATPLDKLAAAATIQQRQGSVEENGATAAQTDKTFAEGKSESSEPSHTATRAEGESPGIEFPLQSEGSVQGEVAKEGHAEVDEAAQTKTQLGLTQMQTENTQQDFAALPVLRSTLEVVQFDQTQIAGWMAEYRHDIAHVPPGVEQFLREVRERCSLSVPLRMSGASSSPLAEGVAAVGKKTKRGLTIGVAGGSKGGSGGFTDLPGRDSTGFTSPPMLRSGASTASLISKKSNALDALGDVWEGRQETPIALGNDTLRRRGLFGGVEKKTIHHMVVAVLNKVSTDAEKFREVKNELLRLPIPEASAEQLTKIVDAFFTKAVREPHFSHSYADLIVSLCKVPQGQHIVGDKTQSLEYRLRAALLKRCQAEFVRSIDTKGVEEGTGSPAGEQAGSPLPPASEGAPGSTGETEKERRDRMCGNVRFVCELFLRDVVAAPVMSVIFRVCCLGSEFGEFALPPSYMPSDMQVDGIITAVNTIKERYFVQTSEGRRMLPLLWSQLNYWMTHYPISRCRFMLMSTVEGLSAWLPKEPASPMLSVASMSATLTTPHLPPTSFPLYAASSLPPPEYGEKGGSTNASPSEAAPLMQAAVDAATQLSSVSTMVSGQPLPAPRSKQVGSTSLSDSAGSINGVGNTESPGTAPVTHWVATLTSRPLTQPVRPEVIAKLMTAFSAAQCTAEEVAVQLFELYGNVMPALAAWLDRCLSVVKEEKTRKRTAEVLLACVAQLSANANTTEEEVRDTVEACREQLQEAALEALERAVTSKLYEDLRVFQFWAQLVLSDSDRRLYDEELLNEGLEMLVYTARPAVRSYLVEVGRYVSQVLAAPDKVPWVPSTETQNFVRYRPLLVLHSLALPGGPAEAQALLDSMVSLSDVRQQSLELRLYHAFRSGSPSREAIFELLRTSPRLTSRDSTFAAEVMSALLVAELCHNGRALVEDHMDLLQVAVDSVVRATREMALVAEVYEVLRYTPHSMNMSAEARVLRKSLHMRILSDETLERADRFYESKTNEVDEEMGQGGRHSTLAVAPSAEPPRITDRGSHEETLSGNTSVRSANDVGGTHGNDTVNGDSGGRMGSVGEGLSSNASSLPEFYPRGTGGGDVGVRRSSHSRRLSLSQGSPGSAALPVSRVAEQNSSKRLYRNAYKNRRRSQGEEGGSERHSSLGGSKDISVQLPPIDRASLSSTYASSHDEVRPHGSPRGRGGSGGGERGRGGRGRGRGGAGGKPRGGGGRGGFSHESSGRGSGGSRYGAPPSRGRREN